MRGLRTLACRMRIHCENAMAIASGTPRQPGALACLLSRIGRRPRARRREEADVRLWRHDVDPRERRAGCSDEDTFAGEGLHARDIAWRSREPHRTPCIGRRGRLRERHLTCCGSPSGSNTPTICLPTLSKHSWLRLKCKPASAIPARRPFYPTESSKEGGVMNTDPVCGMEVNENSEFKSNEGGQTTYFCSNECQDKFEKIPNEFINAA